ncbi:MAG: hypothetical protein ACUVQG_03820 [Thermogutta sp.]
MQIRDRIKELRRVPARELRPNPRNWRVHPQRQQQALRGILAEVGYADALLARELPDGSLELIDGHLRAETTPDAVVPVLVLDVSEDEAKKLLAILDPLAGLAEQDDNALSQLLNDTQFESPILHQLLEEMTHGQAKPEEDSHGSRPENAVDPVPELFQVLVECRSEEEQRILFERLSAEGYTCRLLTL